MATRDRPGSRDLITRTATDAKAAGSPPKAQGPLQACLVIIYGAELGRRIPLSRGVFTVGRSAKSDLCLDHESVSRHHARVHFDGTAYAIRDGGSKNGTYVNDEVIAGDRRLRHGDQIKIGRSILKLIETGDIESDYHEEIYRLMTVDGLTQIFNKRYFTETLDREWARRTRYQRDLSLVLFDLDHFKQINDTYGHLAGDSVLRQLAAAVRGNLREQDIFARVGGEEFAVLLPEVELPGARFAAEKVRRVVQGTSFVFEKTSIPCTISVGCAGSKGKASPSGLYGAADAALYRAKEGGRNRVEEERLA